MRNAVLSAMFLIVCAAMSGCQSAPTSSEEREALRQEVQAALRTMQAEDPGLERVIKNAWGYAIFPSVGKGGLIVGGAYGHGEVYEQGKLIGYSTVTKADIGLQAGGQTYIELIVFQNRQALDRFTARKYQLAANASAVALKAGASQAADFREGMMIFTMPRGGLMVEASVGGQEFSFTPAR